jgi:hypothetical protein
MAKAKRQNTTSRQPTLVERRISEYWSAWKAQHPPLGKYSTAEQRHWRAEKKANVAPTKLRALASAHAAALRLVERTSNAERRALQKVVTSRLSTLRDALALLEFQHDLRSKDGGAMEDEHLESVLDSVYAVFGLLRERGAL